MGLHSPMGHVPLHFGSQVTPQVAMGKICHDLLANLLQASERFCLPGAGPRAVEGSCQRQLQEKGVRTKMQKGCWRTSHQDYPKDPSGQGGGEWNSVRGQVGPPSLRRQGVHLSRTSSLFHSSLDAAIRVILPFSRLGIRVCQFSSCL